MTISLDRIAEKFIELYWRHSLPYPVAEASGDTLLLQNTRGQAAVLTHLYNIRKKRSLHTLPALRARRGGKELIRRTRDTIIEQPLWRLQGFSGQNENFLYPKTDSTLEIRLNPGIPYCLRLFHPLVLQLTRHHWLGHIRAISSNHPLLGKSTDLEPFLFGEERLALTRASELLHDLQKAHCFYCGLRIKEGAEVDHFIPWSRYPRDLGFNFVLAHAKCNREKRDTLASLPHVERWLERNEIHRKEILGHLSDHFTCDSRLTYRVANWAYRLDKEVSAKLWMGVSDYSAYQPEITILLERTLLRNSPFGFASSAGAEP